MNATRIIGLILIVAGIAALGTGGFSFTKETHQVKLGPVELSVKEKQNVNFPIWPAWPRSWWAVRCSCSVERRVDHGVVHPLDWIQ